MSKSKRKLRRAPNQPEQDGPKDEISRSLQDGSKAVVPAEETDPQPSNLVEAIPQISDEWHAPILGRLAGEKVPKLERHFVNPDISHEFKRAMWKHLMRYPTAFMLVLLNVATVGSFIDRLPRHKLMDPWQEIFFALVVAFIDLFLLIPVLFEVNRVQTDGEGLTISTLLWKVRLAWDQLVTYEQPKFLKFSIVRTKKCFYLFNKYDLKPHFELAAIISAKMRPPIEDTEA